MHNKWKKHSQELLEILHSVAKSYWTDLVNLIVEVYDTRIKLVSIHRGVVCTVAAAALSHLKDVMMMRLWTMYCDTAQELWQP